MTIDAKGAAELYVYGYPLVYNTGEIVNLSEGRSSLFPGVPAVGFNAFNKARSLLGPDAKFVSPNNDTLYNGAALDLSGGPLLLHAPDTAGRLHDAYRVLAGHFLRNDARAARIRHRTSCLVLSGATLAVGLLVTACSGTISSAIKSASPNVNLPTAASPESTATSSNPASSLLWLWILLAVLALIIIGYLIARSRRGPKPADIWRSRALDAYAKGSALYDAMELAEAPGALVAADAAARWADIQRHADDLTQTLYTMREAAPDEDKRMRTDDVLAALQAVRSAMAAERGSDVSQAPPPDLVRSRLMSFGASLQALREPDDGMRH